MTLSGRFWRGATLLMRWDIGCSIVIAVGLLLRLAWH